MITPRHRDCRDRLTHENVIRISLLPTALRNDRFSATRETLCNLLSFPLIPFLSLSSPPPLLSTLFVPLCFCPLFSRPPLPSRSCRFVSPDEIQLPDHEVGQSPRLANCREGSTDLTSSTASHQIDIYDGNTGLILAALYFFRTRRTDLETIWRVNILAPSSSPRHFRGDRSLS